ncbi:molecular chaperone [Escherichia coli]|nr:molecular chaperone [Escherichia coli]
MFKNLLLLTSIFVTGIVSANQGGLGLDVSRVIFNEEDSSVSFTAKNTSADITALIKAWVEDYYTGNKDMPFFITPPLTRIDPGDNIQFRINKISSLKTLPSDRESIFSINVLAIPPRKEKAYIQIALNTKIKLIYRPKHLNKKSDIDNVQNNIEVIKTTDAVLLKNPTPYYVTLKNVRINNILTKEPAYVIKPYSDIKLSYINAKAVSFSIINDYGATSSPRVIKINN